MTSLKISGCMAIVNDMSDMDQEDILGRLEQYRKDGIPVERAQLMAVSDVLAELQDERQGFMRMLKEQHPDIFRVSNDVRKTTDRRNLDFKDVVKRTPELQEAAQKLKDGEMTAAEYDELVNRYKPVSAYDEVPEPASVEDMRKALTSDKVERIGTPTKQLEAGHPVGLRLDIPAYSNHGVWVVSVHEQDPGFSAGKSIGYESVAAVKNARFGVVENAALNIAGGKPKATIAVVKGDWEPIKPAMAKARSKTALNSKDWTQVGMDPERHSYFYDRKTMQPVLSADEVIQIGPLVLAKNAVLGEKSDFRFSRDRTSTPEFKRWFGDSKVVDADGKPMVVYHGTTRDFDEFSPSRMGTFGPGIYFAGDAKAAKDYGDGERVVDAYLSLQNPWEVKADWESKLADELDFDSPILDELDELPMGRVLIEEAAKDPGLVGYSYFGQDLQDYLKRIGYDGIIATYPDGSQEIVAFDSKQVKSASENNGEFGDTGNIYKSVDRPQFYSQLQRAIEGVPARLDNMGAAAWKQWLTANAPKLGVKAEEVEWSGIKDYLDLQGKTKLSKDDLAAYLDESGVKISEVALGEVDTDKILDEISNELYEKDYWDLSAKQQDVVVEKMDQRYTSQTKYDKYTLPGGENYRELLITLPSKNDVAGISPVQAARVLFNKEYSQLTEEQQQEVKLRISDEKTKPTYMSSHWQQANVLAHIRVNDRTDADGKRVLFVEEVQSDWGQQGRDKGFGGLTAEQTARREELGNKVRRGTATSAEIDESQELMRLANQSIGLVPSAPFVTKTEGWLNLALKRIAIMAVEGGYDKVAFVNGGQASDRFNLTNEIGYVSYLPRGEGKPGLFEAWDNNRKQIFANQLLPEQLEDYIGKEVTERLLATEPKFGKHTLEGLDLKTGGEGMKAFYDQIVPQAVNKLLPKIGGEKLVTVAVGDAERGDVYRDGKMVADNVTREEYEGAWEGRGTEFKAYPENSLSQTGFDVTDKMRETVGAGLPLFSRDRTQTAEFKKWFGDSKVVDADGKPLVMYTGTSKDKDFTKFNIPKNGAWFTTSPEEASMYAKENDSRDLKYEGGRYVEVNTASRVMPVYLRIENPATLSEEDTKAMRMAGNYKKVQGQIFDKLRAQGYDGVDLGGGVWVVIGDAKQIKSAIGNSGQFDPKNADIRKSADRTNTAEFKKWFGDSKVVNAKGEPLVVYHGTNEDFAEFDPAKSGSNYAQRGGNRGFFFTNRPVPAGVYAEQAASAYFGDEESLDFGDGTANIMPVYLSLQRPYERKAQGSPDKWFDANNAAIFAAADKAGADGIIVRGGKGFENRSIYIVFKPTQIKSATGNNGEFDGTNPDIRKSTARKPWFEDLSKLKVSTNYQLGDLLKTSKKLSWWDRTVGTQYNLAQKHAGFKRVFDAVQTFINDVSAYATRAADMAQDILPKLESWRDIGKAPLSAEDVKALRDPIFGGTLKYTRDDEGKIVETDDVEKAGVVFTPEELRSMFNLTDKQIDLYRQFRSATDQSITDLALSDMLRYIGEDGADIREAVMASGNVDVAVGIIKSQLEEIAANEPKRTYVIKNTISDIEDKADQANRLMDRGYAPLSRFGQYTVYAVGQDGEQIYFSMFENERDANKMAKEMREQYPDATVTTGTMSQESYKLFSGVTPETLALFGESLGLEENGIDKQSEAYQQMLKVAKTNRSAMKRLIQRKGIDGFSEDAGRVLAGFVYSNARQISTNLHAGEIGRSVQAIDQRDGDVKDQAVRLMEYIQNPQEEAQAIRGLLFTQFIGGSVASAMVNMTQPFTMTLPYLSQFGGAMKAGAAMKDALGLVTRGVRNDDDLKRALKRAEDEGVVSPQEVHQLMAQAQGQGKLQSGDGTKVGNALAKTNNFMAKVGLGWGKLFSAAEQFNRRITFIAAYKLAREQGIDNPFAFAEKAIAESQGVYNKGNKPNWARGAVGGTLFTFKQYSIAYVEFLRRMWGNGPEGKKAVGLALAVLFMTAGLGGMPGADDMDDVIDGFAQRVLGKSFDTKQAKKEFFASILGQTGAEFVMGGLTGIPGAPIDLSGRMGLGNLIPGTGILTKKKDYGRDISEVFGPAGTFFSNIAAAGGSLAQGEVGKAAESLSPVAAANVIKAFDMATMGMYRDQKGRKVIDVEGWEAAVKALGFQPGSVKRVQDATSTQQGLIAQNKLRETEIADKWAAGRIERNPAKVEDAKAELAEWNRKNPQSPIKIDQGQINKRVQQAMMSKAQRLEKTAPKEIRQSVKQELDRAN